MNPEPIPSPAEGQDTNPDHPNRVYVGTFNGYRCYIEDPEAVAQAIQRAAYRMAIAAEKETA